MCERYIDQFPLAHPQWGTWPAAQASALTGNRTGGLSVRRPAFNPLSHTSQGDLDTFEIYRKIVLQNIPQMGLRFPGSAFWAGTSLK